MKRVLVASFAFSIGMTGAFVAARSTSSNREMWGNGHVGTLDIDDYCQRAHSSDSFGFLTRPMPAGWRCVSRRNGMFATWEVDADEGCRQQYGMKAYADPLDLSWPYTWSCRVSR